MALPSNVSTGTVTGQFIVAVADGSDSDYAPDGTAASGTITFTPSVNYLPDPTGGVTILPDAVTGILDDAGYLCTPDPDNPSIAGRRGVQLIATDDPDISVSGWTWKVQYAFLPRIKKTPPRIPDHSILIPSGGVVDLAYSIKVPSSTGLGVDQVMVIRAAAVQSAAEAAASAILAGSRATDAAGFAAASAGSAGAAAASVASSAGIAAQTVTDALPVQVPPLVAAVMASNPAPAAAAAAAVTNAIAGADLVTGTDPRLARTVKADDYAIPFADAGGRVSGGVRADGAFGFEREPVVKGVQDVTLKQITAPGWTHVMADAGGRVGLGVGTDGVTRISKLEVLNETSSRTRVTAIGDSLTATPVGDSYPDRLAALLPGVTVTNRGASGNTVDELRLRLNALDLYVTVAGGTIPATVTPVSLTTGQVVGWYTNSARQHNGYIAGVQGVIDVSTTGALTFTRSEAGAVTAAPGVQKFTSWWPDHSSDTLIVYLGANDITANVKGMEATVADHVVASTVAIVEWARPRRKQVLLMGTITRTDEPRGSAGYNTTVEINTRLAALYPGRFLDIRRYLIDQAIYDAGITPTADDLAHMADDTLPPSIMLDARHYTGPIARLIAEKKVAPFLTQKGWV